jgi:TPR repeat protein
MLRWLLPSSLALLLCAQGAAAQQKDAAGFRCETLLKVLPIMRHPQVHEAYAKPGASLMDVLENIDALAAMDNADAQFAIGRMQQHGICAQQNTAGALAYLTRAAENGSRDAQEALASAYAAGKDAPSANRMNIAPDPVKAYAWSRVVGDERTVSQIRHSMTPAQIGEAEVLSTELTRKLAARAAKR